MITSSKLHDFLGIEEVTIDAMPRNSCCVNDKFAILSGGIGI